VEDAFSRECNSLKLNGFWRNGFTFHLRACRANHSISPKKIDSGRLIPERLHISGFIGPGVAVYSSIRIKGLKLMEAIVGALNFFLPAGAGLKTPGDGGSDYLMKKLIRNIWLQADILRVVLTHLKTGVNCWMTALYTPCDLLCWLQYSQAWMREQYHESQYGLWRKDLKQ